MAVASLYIYILLLGFILIALPNLLAQRCRQPTRRRVAIALLTLLPNVAPVIPSFGNPVYLFILQFDPIAWIAWGIAMRMACSERAFVSR